MENVEICVPIGSMCDKIVLDNILIYLLRCGTPHNVIDDTLNCIDNCSVVARYMPLGPMTSILFISTLVHSLKSVSTLE